MQWGHWFGLTFSLVGILTGMYCAVTATAPLDLGYSIGVYLAVIAAVTGAFCTVVGYCYRASKGKSS